MESGWLDVLFGDGRTHAARHVMYDAAPLGYWADESGDGQDDAWSGRIVVSTLDDVTQEDEGIPFAFCAPMHASIGHQEGLYRVQGKNSALYHQVLVIEPAPWCLDGCVVVWKEAVRMEGGVFVVKGATAAVLLERDGSSSTRHQRVPARDVLTVRQMASAADGRLIPAVCGYVGVRSILGESTPKFAILLWDTLLVQPVTRGNHAHDATATLENDGAGDEEMDQDSDWDVFDAQFGYSSDEKDADDEVGVGRNGGGGGGGGHDSDNGVEEDTEGHSAPRQVKGVQCVVELIDSRWAGMCVPGTLIMLVNVSWNSNLSTWICHGGVRPCQADSNRRSPSPFGPVYVGTVTQCSSRFLVELDHGVQLVQWVGRLLPIGAIVHVWGAHPTVSGHPMGALLACCPRSSVHIMDVLGPVRVAEQPMLAFLDPWWRLSVRQWAWLCEVEFRLAQLIGSVSIEWRNCILACGGEVAQEDEGHSCLNPLWFHGHCATNCSWSRCSSQRLPQIRMSLGWSDPMLELAPAPWTYSYCEGEPAIWCEASPWKPFAPASMGSPASRPRTNTDKACLLVEGKTSAGGDHPFVVQGWGIVANGVASQISVTVTRGIGVRGVVPGLWYQYTQGHLSWLGRVPTQGYAICPIAQARCVCEADAIGTPPLTGLFNGKFLWCPRLTSVRIQLFTPVWPPDRLPQLVRWSGDGVIQPLEGTPCAHVAAELASTGIESLDLGGAKIMRVTRVQQLVMHDSSGRGFAVFRGDDGRVPLRIQVGNDVFLPSCLKDRPKHALFRAAPWSYPGSTAPRQIEAYRALTHLLTGPAIGLEFVLYDETRPAFTRSRNMEAGNILQLLDLLSRHEPLPAAYAPLFAASKVVLLKKGE